MNKRVHFGLKGGLIMGKKRYLFLFVTIICLIFLSPKETASAKIFTGTCGENATWTWDKKKEKVVISGTGTVTEVINAGNRAIMTKKIIIEEGITSIEAKGVFSYIEPDGSVTLKLPDSFEKIGARDFSGICFVDKLHIPKNVKIIENGSFLGMDFKEITVSNKNPCFVSKNGVLFSKDFKTLLVYPEYKEGTLYKVPDSVTKIAPLAFASNYNIKKVVLPNRLKVLGSGAFSCCHGLKEVNLEDTKIKKLTDYDGDIFGKYVVGEWDWYYGHEYLPGFDGTDEPFFDEECGRHRYAGTFEATSITYIKFPKTLWYAEGQTFAHSRLKTLVFNEKFHGEINTGELFNERDSLQLYLADDLERVEIPKGNTRYCVEDDILYSKDKKTLYQIIRTSRNRNKQKIVINKKVTRIGTGAFYEFYTKKGFDLVIQGNIEEIGYSAFSWSGINKFRCNGTIKRLPMGAFYESRIESFICKEGLECIEAGAFKWCSDLKKIKLGKQLKYIGEEAFYECVDLEKVILPDTLEEVGKEGFARCRSLKEITYPESVRLGKDVFEECSSKLIRILI